MPAGIRVQRRAGEAHALRQRRQTVVGAEAGPVVVCAIEDVFLFMLIQYRLYINPGFLSHLLLGLP